MEASDIRDKKRAARINALWKAVREGGYQVKPSEIASKIIDKYLISLALTAKKGGREHEN